MKKTLITLLIIAGIVATVLMIVFLDLTIPQIILNGSCIVILVAVLIRQIIIASKKTVLPEKGVK